MWFGSGACIRWYKRQQKLKPKNLKPKRLDPMDRINYEDSSESEIDKSNMRAIRKN